MIVEDQALLRELLKAVVADAGGFEIVKEFEDAESALEAARLFPPTFVLVDMVLPGMGGVDLIRELVATCDGVSVLGFSQQEEPQLVQQALAAGANGFVIKSASVELLRSAIQAVQRGQSFFCPMSTELLRQGLATPLDKRVDSLTKQEKGILQLYASGLSVKEIAARLGISVGTAGNHMTRVRQKLDIYEPAALVRFAADNGLVKPIRTRSG